MWHELFLHFGGFPVLCLPPQIGGVPLRIPTVFSMSSINIRNLAIIAHVDHGKTTLVDQLLKAGGTYREKQATTERAMDSM